MIEFQFNFSMYLWIQIVFVCVASGSFLIKFTFGSHYGASFKAWSSMRSLNNNIMSLTI